VKLLLDTHIYLWWLATPTMMADEARIAIANPRNHVFVSSVSIIEIAIKQANGKLKTEEAPETMLESCRFHEMPLTVAHAAALRNLPPIHKDPFDRLLAAQALTEGMTLVTRDPVLRQYAVPIIAA
jgi:PIN domain nuclease of toxin-antitoxin system